MKGCCFPLTVILCYSLVLNFFPRKVCAKPLGALGKPLPYKEFLMHKFHFLHAHTSHATLCCDVISMCVALTNQYCIIITALVVVNIKIWRLLFFFQIIPCIKIKLFSYRVTNKGIKKKHAKYFCSWIRNVKDTGVLVSLPSASKFCPGGQQYQRRVYPWQSRG